MSRFANTIDNQPIYAARAEADKNGDRIDTTYAKLTDIPTVPVTDVEVNGTSVVSGGVAEVTVPTKTSDLTNDSNFITLADVPAQVQADWSESDSDDPSYIQHKPDLSIYAQSANLATVATSGNYNDLSNLPTIPPAVTVDQHYDAQSSNPQSGTAVAEALSGTGQVPTVTSSDDSKVLTATYSGGKGSYSWQPASASTQVNADWEATSGVAEILHKPDLSVYAETADLATVATTGDYDDLVDAPTIVGLSAGANVTITEANNTVTIAATDTTYTAGTGISISGGAISNSDPIPSHTSTQSGKVLGVDSNGDLDWVTPAASQVQADWNESDSSAPSFIQNKPTIPSVDQFFNPASTNAQSGTAVAGALSTISQVPPTSQASTGDVLTVDQYGDAAWVAPSAQAQVQSDWTEFDPTAVSYIQHKPTQKPLVAGQNVVLTEGANNITIDCTASGGSGSSAVVLTYGTSTWSDFSDALATTKDIIVEETATTGTNYYVFAKLDKNPMTQAITGAVFSSIGTATMPRIVTLTTASAWSRTNTSLQQALTAGQNITISNNVISATDTTYSAGEGIDITGDVISVEAPVDIVAGPGIVIDNPDGNTLRVSTDENYETVLWEGTAASVDTAKSGLTLTESPFNFEYVEVHWVPWAYNDAGSYKQEAVVRVHLTSSFPRIGLINEWTDESNAAMFLFSVNGYFTSTKFYTTHVKWFQIGTWTVNNTGTGQYITRIVGIHRIANN